MWNKDEKMIELLNTQYNLELAAANMYIHFSTVANKLGYTYTSEFLKGMADDKIEAHLSRLFNYFTDLDLEIKINQNSLPRTSESKTVHEMVKEMLSFELYLRKHINYIADYALSIKDYESFEFIQWFVKDAIKDVGDMDDVLTYIDTPNSSMLTIENSIRRKMKEDKE